MRYRACDALTEPGAYIAMQFASTALSKPDVARSKPGAYIAMQFASTALSKPVMRSASLMWRSAGPLELQCLETVAGFDHVFPVAE